MPRILLTILLGLAIPGWVEAQGVFLRGRVIFDDGSVRSDIVVRLEGISSERYDAVLTDVKGSFIFPRVPNTVDYVYIVVEEDGYIPVRLELNRRAVAIQGVEIVLVRDSNSAAAGDGSTVDAEYLLLPEEAREEYERALEEARDGDYEDAVERLERALSRAPDFYDAWINLGVANLELGRFRDSESAYERALELRPDDELGVLNLGVLYYREGEFQAGAGEDDDATASFENAMEVLLRSAQLDPSSPAPRFYLGATMYKLGRFADAEALLESVLEIEATHPQARLTLLNVYARQARYEDALEQAVAFLEENPDSPQRPSIERVQSQLEAALER